MYDQAAQAQFINTYAPINFSELYRIGATQKAAMDEAAQQFGAALQKFGEFRSPSVVDTQNWYNLTIGRKDMQDAINQLATNPEALKDAGFRASLQSLINSTDYASLSKLKESADNLRNRQKVIAELQARGEYSDSPYWDNIDIGNWNTLDEGVMTQLSPLRYQSLRDTLAPYVDSIQAQFFTGKSPLKGISRPYYDWQAITPEMRYKVLNEKFSDIINTPSGNAWYQQIADNVLRMNPNATKEDLANAFMNSMLTVTAYKDTEMPVLNQAKLQTDLAYLNSKKSGSESNVSIPITRMSVIQSDAQNAILRKSEIEANQLAKEGIITTGDMQNMTLEDRQILLSTIATDIKENGLKNKYMIPVQPGEYYKYWDSEGVQKTQFTDKDGKALSDQNDMEQYSYRTGDIVFTKDGYALNSIPNAMLTRTFFKDVVNNFQIGDDSEIPGLYTTAVSILQQLTQDNSAFKVTNGDNAFVYNDGEDGMIQNNVKVTGTLYVTRDALEDAVEKVNPDLSDEILDLLTDGFTYKTKTGQERKAHAVLEESDNRLKGEKTYAIKVGRNMGSSASGNDLFNSGYIKEMQGTTAVREGQYGIIDSSFTEAE